jgi:hypothetical protein
MGGHGTAWSAASASLSPDVEWPRARSDLRDSFGRAAAKPASAGASRCVIAALFVSALLILAATFAVRAIVRALRIRGGADCDRAQQVLEFAVRGLPADRVDWAQAMLVELDQVEGRQERWQFSLGCAWGAARIRVQSPEPGGVLLRVVVLGGATIALALVGYGLVRYPGLRSEPNVGGAMIVFLATLLTYILLTVSLSRGATERSAVARRYGLTGGLAVGVGWLLGIAPPSALKGWVFLPLLIALLGPALVAAAAGHRARDSRTGTLAALWSGLVGGLTVFIVWVTVTYTNAGGPYDAGLVRDFHKSSAHDLVTYAVSDNLGSGLVLLLMIPTVALALGSLSARVPAPTRRT